MKQKVYLMRNDFDLYKIGISNNPKKRAADIANNAGVPTTLIKSWESFNAPVTEKRLHEKFKGSRKKGEWFSLTKQELKLIDEEYKQLDSLLPVKDITECNITELPCQQMWMQVIPINPVSNLDELNDEMYRQYKILSNIYKKSKDN